MTCRAAAASRGTQGTDQRNVVGSDLDRRLRPRHARLEASYDGSMPPSSERRRFTATVRSQACVVPRRPPKLGAACGRR